MTDVGEVEDVKSPESMMAIMSSSPRDASSIHSAAPPLQAHSGELDSWIEILSKCRQLPEDDVKRLCEKVIFLFSAHGCALISLSRREKYYRKNPMFNPYGVRSLCVAIFTANSTTYKNFSA